MIEIAEFLIKNKISFRYEERISHDIIFCGWVGDKHLKKLIKLCEKIKGIKYLVNPEGFVITYHKPTKSLGDGEK